MDAWLSQARDALASATGIPRDELRLDDEAVRELLDLARIAAHDSGERINAPLLTYLVGVAVGRGGDLDAAADAVRATP